MLRPLILCQDEEVAGVSFLPISTHTSAVTDNADMSFMLVDAAANGSNVAYSSVFSQALEFRR